MNGIFQKTYERESLGDLMVHTKANFVERYQVTLKYFLDSLTNV